MRAFWVHPGNLACARKDCSTSFKRTRRQTHPTYTRVATHSHPKRALQHMCRPLTLPPPLLAMMCLCVHLSGGVSVFFLSVSGRVACALLVVARTWSPWVVCLPLLLDCKAKRQPIFCYNMQRGVVVEAAAVVGDRLETGGRRGCSSCNAAVCCVCAHALCPPAPNPSACPPCSPPRQARGCPPQSVHLVCVFMFHHPARYLAEHTRPLQESEAR